jgi:hypothetical protein
VRGNELNIEKKEKRLFWKRGYRDERNLRLYESRQSQPYERGVMASSRPASASKSPTIIRLEEAEIHTPVMDSVAFSLGEPSTDMCTAENPGPPVQAFARCQPRTSVNSHYHDCYSVLMFTEGSYDIGNVLYGPGTVVMIEPGAESGECFPGPSGVRELGLYATTYGTIPFFIDPSDPRSVEMINQMPDGGAYFRSLKPPGSNKAARAYTLDYGKHGIVTPGFTAYTCQVGPAGFGAVPNAVDPTPFAALVHFNPGCEIPTHSHNGWSSIVVIEGECKVSGITQAPYVAALFEPGTPVSFKIGPAGARAFLCFDSGKCAIPVFEYPSDPAVMSLLAGLPRLG